MEFHLLVSYKPVKNPSGHPSQIRLKFRPVSVITSSDLKTDSIGGPKSTLLQVISDDSVPHHKVSRRCGQSFLVAEFQNTHSHLIPISKVSLRFSVSRPLSSVSGDTQGQHSQLYDPKFDLTVYASGKSVPILRITEATIHHKTLFCEKNFVWFKDLMGDQLSLEVTYQNGIFAHKIGESTVDTPTSQTCSNNLISLLQRFACKELEPSKAPIKRLMLSAAQFDRLVRLHMQDKVDKYDAACSLLKENIPLLDVDNPTLDSPPPVLWKTIQDNLRVISDFLKICMEIHGVGELFQGTSSECNKFYTSYLRFRTNLDRSICRCWYVPAAGDCSIKNQHKTACKSLHRELSFDVIANNSSMLESMALVIKDLENSKTADIAIFSVMHAILRGSDDFGCRNPRPNSKVVGRLVARENPGSADIHEHEYDESMNFAAAFAYKLDEDILLVWPRIRNCHNSIKLSSGMDIQFFRGQMAHLILLDHSGPFVLIRDQKSNFRVVILNIIECLAKGALTTDHIATCLRYPANGIYCLNTSHLYIFAPDDDSPRPTTKFRIVPLKKTYSGIQLKSMTEAGIPYLVTTAFAIREQPYVFVASAHQLGCWFWLGDVFGEIAGCKLDALAGQDPQPSTTNETYSSTQCLDFRPRFFESRKKVYFARILNQDFLQLYAFYLNQFILVTKGNRTLHRPPEGYFWLSDTSGSRISLCAAKQVNSDPKTFRICKLLLP